MYPRVQLSIASHSTTFSKDHDETMRDAWLDHDKGAKAESANFVCRYLTTGTGLTSGLIRARFGPTQSPDLISLAYLFDTTSKST